MARLPDSQTTPFHSTVMQSSNQSSRVHGNIGLGVFFLALGIVIFSHTFADSHPDLADAVALASFSLPLLGLAFVQWRSGYLWRTLSPGKQGLHRTEAPGVFWFLTAFKCIMGVAVVGYMVWVYFSGQ